MNRWLSISACLFAVVLGCAVRDAPDGQVDSPQLVPVEAEVVRYIQQSLREYHEDGGWAVFDAVEFRMTLPPKWRGKKLLVYCHPGTKNPVFQSVGARCRFNIKEEYLLERHRLSRMAQAKGIYVNLRERFLNRF